MKQKLSVFYRHLPSSVPSSTPTRTVPVPALPPNQAHCSQKFTFTSTPPCVFRGVLVYNPLPSSSPCPPLLCPYSQCQGLLWSHLALPNPTITEVSLVHFYHHLLLPTHPSTAPKTTSWDYTGNETLGLQIPHSKIRKHCY